MVQSWSDDDLMMIWSWSDPMIWSSWSYHDLIMIVVPWSCHENYYYILLCTLRSSDHNESCIISTTAIAHSHPPYGAPLFEMRAPATKLLIIQASHAVLEWYRVLNNMCALPEPEIALPQRSSDRQQKAWKSRQCPCFLQTPHPIPPTPLFTIIK